MVLMRIHERRKRLVHLHNPDNVHLLLAVLEVNHDVVGYGCEDLVESAMFSEIYELPFLLER